MPISARPGRLLQGEQDVAPIGGLSGEYPARAAGRNFREVRQQADRLRKPLHSRRSISRSAASGSRVSNSERQAQSILIGIASVWQRSKAIVESAAPSNRSLRASYRSASAWRTSTTVTLSGAPSPSVASMSHWALSCSDPSRSSVLAITSGEVTACRPSLHRSRMSPAFEVRHHGVGGHFVFRPDGLG